MARFPTLKRRAGPFSSSGAGPLGRRTDAKYARFHRAGTRGKTFMKKLALTLLQTSGSVVPLILRIVLAAVMFPHGAQKALGWFGGSGFALIMATFHR